MDLFSALGAISFLLSLFLLFKVLEVEKELKKVSEYYRDLHKVEKHILLLRKEFAEIDEKYGEVGAIARRLKELEEIWKPLKVRVESLEKGLEAAKGDISRLEEIAQSLHAKVGTLEEMKGSIEALDAQLKDVIKKSNLLEESLTRIDTQTVQNRENIERLERSIDALSERIEDISTVVGSYLQFRDEVLSKVSDLSTKAATIEGRVKKLESFVDYMRGVERNVREIKAKFDAFEKSKGLLFDLLMELKEDVKKLKKMLDKVRAPEVYDSILALQQELDKIVDSVKDMREELSATRRALYSLKEKYDYLTLPGRADLEFFSRELERVERKVRELDERLG